MGTRVAVWESGRSQFGSLRFAAYPNGNAAVDNSEGLAWVLSFTQRVCHAVLF